MRIFLVTPTYNRIGRLKQALESVKAQSHKDFTWLIINDGSSVELSEFDFLFEDKRVRLVHICHGGVNAARIMGLSVIRERDAVVIEHGDNDLLDPRCVEHIKRAFDEQGADAVYGDHEVIDADGEVRARIFKPDYRPGLFKDGNIACGISAYSLAVARSAGGWRMNDWPGGDYSLFLRMENLGVKFVCVPKKLGQVRVEPRSISVTYWPEQIAASNRYRELAVEGML